MTTTRGKWDVVAAVGGLLGLIAFGIFIFLYPSSRQAQSSEPVEVNEYGTPIEAPSQRGMFWVVVIDGCEYLQRGQSFAHKGNCKNPEHRGEEK